MLDALPFRAQPKMDQPEIQDLFRRFAALVASYAATSEERRELAEVLVKRLWTATIAGPRMEVETWRVLSSTGNLAAESLQAAKDVYFQQMRPAGSARKHWPCFGSDTLRRIKAAKRQSNDFHWQRRST
jgi:ClpP class serine protease